MFRINDLDNVTHNYFMLVSQIYNNIHVNYVSSTEADTGFRERGGVGCRGYGYFILGNFVAGHMTRCLDNMLGDKTPVKIARGDKMPAILWNREAKMPILSKHFTYDSDDQVN